MQDDDISMGRPVEPPPEVGETLAILPHHNGVDYIRVSAESRGPGRKLVRLQGWARNDVGESWPWRGRSVAIRDDQVEDLIAALERSEGPTRGDGGHHLRLAPAEPGNEACEPYNPYGAYERPPAPRSGNRHGDRV